MKTNYQYGRDNLHGYQYPSGRAQKGAITSLTDMRIIESQNRP